MLLFFFTAPVSARLENPWTYNLEKGRKQYAVRMYNDASDSMKLALKKNPQCFEAANILAQIALINRDMYTAEKYLIISLEINDAQPDIHTSMGRIDEYFQRDDSAMEHYKKSVSLNPENPAALINLSRINFKKGNTAEAEKYYKICYDSGIDRSSVIYKKAEEMRRKDPSGAAAEYRKAIEINPAHTAAYIGLADSYRQRGLYDDAVTVLEELKSNRPDYPLTYIYLGNIYLNNKPDRKLRKHFINLSIQNFEKAIQLEPQNSDLYLQLSLIYRMTGNRDRADELEQKGHSIIDSEK